MDSSRTVSACPSGQVAGSAEAAIGRCSVNVVPQERQRNSYVGIAAQGRSGTGPGRLRDMRGRTPGAAHARWEQGRWMVTELLGTMPSALPAGAALLLAVALLVVGDAVLPVLPSETAVVSAGVLVAATGVTTLPWLVVVAACAAVVGDLVSYRLGRTGSRRWQRVRRSRTRRGAALRYAQAALDRRGPAMVAASRFVPGGRTAVTLSAGASAMPVRAFVVASVVGASVWASAFAAVGFVGGQALGDNVVVALSLAVAAVLGLSALAEGGRRAMRLLRRPVEPVRAVTAVTR